VGGVPPGKIVPVPVHVDTAPVPDSVHVTALLAGSEMGRLTVPDGVVGPLAVVSVTVAVQVMGWLPVTVVGVHTTLRVVACKLATVSCTEPELVA
jgi:hypothetical protein